MPQELTPTLDTLLVHADFLRRLARSLVRDDAAAQDLVQETWIAALRRPPTREGGRSWLSAVIRNLARERGRRSAARAGREATVARAEELPSVEEITAREGARRDVVEAVIALDEPYRTTLLHRYYQDLPAREIAARLGVPIETVRTRIKRGLDRLRGRLDARHGGERAAWCALVAPLAAPPTGSVPVAAAAGVGRGSLVALPWVWVTAVAAIVAVVVLLHEGSRDDVLRVPTATARPIAADNDESDAQHARTEEAAGSGLIATGARGARAPVAVEPRGATVLGTVVDAVSRSLLPGQTVFLAGLQIDEYEAEAALSVDMSKAWVWKEVRSDALGAYRFDALDPGSYLLGTAPGGTHAPSLGAALVVGLDAGADEEEFHGSLRSTLALLGVEGARLFESEPDGHNEVTLRAPVSGAVRGVVRDARGAPIAAAEVVLLPAFAAALSGARPGEVDGAMARIMGLAKRVETDAAGAFRLEGIGAIGFALVRAEGFARGQAQIDVAPGEEAQVVIELEPAAVWTVRGTVVDAEGAPVPGARVFLRPEADTRALTPAASEEERLALSGRPSRVTDERGAFAFEGVTGLLDSQWAVEAPATEARALAFADGRPPALSEPLRAGVASQVELVFPAGAPFVGSVVDARDGRPVAASVVISERSGRRVGELSTDESGRFAAAPIAYGELRLRVESSGFESAELALHWTGAPDVVIELQPAAWSVRGRVVDPGGAAVPGTIERRFGRLSTQRPRYRVTARHADPRPLGRRATGAMTFSGTAPSARIDLDPETGSFEVALGTAWGADTAWLVLSAGERELDAVEVRPGGGGATLVFDPRVGGTGVIELRAKDAATGKTIEDFHADLYRREDRADAGHAAVVSRGSRFAEVEAPDVYDIRVHAEGFGAIVLENVAVDTDGRIGPLLARLPAGATIRGILRFPPGTDEPSRANPSVRLFDHAGRWIPGPSVGLDGAFEFAGLGPGTYELVARHWGGSTASARLDLAAGQTRELELELAKTPFVRFRFSDDLRERFTGGFLRIEDVTGRMLSRLHLHRLGGHPDEGRIALEPGTYRAELSGNEGVRVEAPFTVIPETMTTVDLPARD